MDAAYLKLVVSHLEAGGVGFESGLSDEEVRAVEEHFGFVFPPDLREFLQFALPIATAYKPWGTRRSLFPNWRTPDEEEIREDLAWPLEGMCFDIEQNTFWNQEWGAQPDSLEEAFAVAREVVAQAPVLIPICGHRYLPDRPYAAGNPVFSVWQTDIIIYGDDLPSYFEQEFKFPNPYPKPSAPRTIEFWSGPW